MTDEERNRPTRPLDPRELSDAGITPWPYIASVLDRAGPWLPTALRLGTIALLQGCVTAMAEDRASPELLERAHELLEALRHMPWHAP